jgi:hypothetical protein
VKFDEHISNDIGDERQNSNPFERALDHKSQFNSTEDLKAINNLKLFKRRTKDFYEENRKRPALFSMNSARLVN